MSRKYELNIPVYYHTLLGEGAEEIRAELERVGADRVFVTVGFYETDPEKRTVKLREIRRAVETVRAWGYGVGIWTWAFAIKQKHPFTVMCDTDGNPSEPFCCPADPAFRTFALDRIAEYAALSPDLILLDDDLRYPNNALGCSCPHHRKLLYEKFGREVGPQEYFSFFVGHRTDERQMFREVMGNVLYGFASDVRRRIDAINPHIRCGYCSSGTSWFLDGTNAVVTARLLAGGTEPFMRLHAAPYWSSQYGNSFRPALVYENSRMQAAWAAESFDQVLAEGDVFPRPRYQTPAALLEAFDTVMCTEPDFGGIMKYTFDYTSGVSVERGYNDRHVKHLPVYRRLREEVSVLPPCGVRIYEYRDKLADADIDGMYSFYDLLSYDRTARAGLMLADCNVPTTYHGDGLPGAVFGNNAAKLPLNAADSGLILDVPAALILQKRGVDVGLIAAEAGLDPKEECFPDGIRAKIWENSGLYKIQADEKAHTVSSYVCGSDYQKETGTDAETFFPAAYTYENAAGQRFFVLAVDGYRTGYSVFRFYEKSDQLYRAAEYVSGKPLPAVCAGHPDLYVICRGDENTLAVGLWNNFADDIPAPLVSLAKMWKTVDFIAGGGRLDGNRVLLDDMTPYSFTVFILRA